MRIYHAAVFITFASLALTTAAMRLSRLTFRLGWFQPLLKSLLQTERRHFRQLWDRRRWRFRDEAFCFVAALPTAALLLQASLTPANRTQLLVAAGTSLLLTALAACDRQFKCLPTPILIAATAAGLLFSTTPYGFVRPEPAILAAIGAFLFIGIPCAVVTAITGRICIGPTDLWLAAALGAFLGWSLALLAMSIGATAFLLLLLPTRSSNRSGRAAAALDLHPFGLPTAIAAAYVMLTEALRPGLLLDVCARVVAL